MCKMSYDEFLYNVNETVADYDINIDFVLKDGTVVRVPQDQLEWDDDGEFTEESLKTAYDIYLENFEEYQADLRAKEEVESWREQGFQR